MHSLLFTAGLGDADSCAAFSSTLPLVTVGASVPQRWPRMSKPEVPSYPTKYWQTETSADAPAFLAVTATQLGVAGPLGAYEYLSETQRLRRGKQVKARFPADSYAMRRDDTVNSLDTPSWMSKTLHEQHAPPALCDPAQMWRVGARNRVFLSPLVEIDPFTGRAPRQLPPPRGAPGYIPNALDLSRIQDFHAKTYGGDRLGVTTASEVGPEAWNTPLARLQGATSSATLPPQSRFGSTSAAVIGSPMRGAALLDTIGPSAESYGGPLRKLPTHDKTFFRDEPPFSSYFAGRRENEELPSLKESAQFARWTGVSTDILRATRGAAQRDQNLEGHALFRAVVQAHGAGPCKHNQAARQVANETLSSTGLLGVHKPNFKVGPLHWYGTSR
jgi:hypothetical protein